jgi:hypothetical protein
MKSLFLVLLVSSSAFAQAVGSENSLPSNQYHKIEIKLEGEADVFFEVAQLPSSVQGQTRFDFALLQLTPEIKLDQNLGLNFRFLLAGERSTSEKNYLNEVQNAYLTYQESQNQKLIHQLGLIRNDWITNEKTARDLDFFGDSGKSLARRYGFVSESELGYQAQYRQNDRIHWAMGFSNGEENEKDEAGPNKEAFVGMFYQNSKQMNLALWISLSRVDRLDTQINEKNRLLLTLEKRWGRFAFGLEALYAQDPSLNLESSKRLEGIKFTELLDPKEIKTSGGRLNLNYDLSDKQVVVLRFDQLKPEGSKKDIRSHEVAWVKTESPLMRWGVFYEKTEFGAQHSSQSKLRELGRLGIEVRF